MTTSTGTVKWFNDQKGFGFIQPENGGNDVFVHISAVEKAGMRTLKEGQTISFDLQRDPKKGKDSAANLKEAAQDGHLMNSGPIKIRILIVNNDFAETDTIKSWLEKDMRVPWSMSHCVSIEEAKSCINKADVVILKPEMEGILTSKEVFQSIDDMVFEVPILVLKSAEDEHGLSTYVMEQGAADMVIRGQFTRLVDAIEFALIRQKLKTDARKTTDKNLTDSQDKNVVHNEKQRQILRMLGGDYAVDQQDKTKK